MTAKDFSLKFKDCSLNLKLELLNFKEFFFEIQRLIFKNNTFSFKSKDITKFILSFKNLSPLISIFFRLHFRKNVEIQQFTFEILKINYKFQSLMF